jgi:hypothetical protein
MSEIEIILLVITAIYFTECACWLRADAVAFLSRGRDRWRLAHPSAWLGNLRAGLIFSNPLPPLGSAIIAQQWPLSISPDAIYSYVAQTLSRDGRADQREQYCRFEDIASIEASEKNLLINKEIFLQTVSPRYARHLAALIKKLAALPQEKRAAAINAALTESLNKKSLAKRLQEFRQRAAFLRAICNLLFIYIFSAVIALIWLPWLSQQWPWLLLLLLMLMMVITARYYRLHRSFYPDGGAELLTKIFALALSPPVNIHAYGALSRHLLATYHPLAIAQALCEAESFREFARWILIDLHYPLAPICPSEQAGPRATEAWFRASLLDAIEQFIKQAGINREDLLAPPAPDNENSRCYCPRCLSQYGIEAGECENCGGISLLSFFDKKAEGGRREAEARMDEKGRKAKGERRK